MSSGKLLGSSTAAVKIIEFADMECPYCAKFNKTLRRVRDEHPNDVALVFVHLPITGHRFARPAARALECAGRQNKFGQLVDAIYAGQDSLGLKPWNTFAIEAGVSDTVAFAQCNSSPDPLSSVDAGVQLADKFQVHGTPTILVNGWRYSSPPSDSTLTRTIQNLILGKPPAGSDD